MKEVFLGLTGFHWALLGAATAAIGGGVGSAIGITYINKVASGILVEDPDKFGPILPLCAIPGTQGIYGFITAVLVVFFFGIFGGEGGEIAGKTGLEIFFACQPVAWACLFSAMYQGLSSAGTAGMVAKRTEEAGKALILPALVETYAALSLIITIILLLSTRAGL